LTDKGALLLGSLLIGVGVFAFYFAFGEVTTGLPYYCERPDRSFYYSQYNSGDCTKSAFGDFGALFSLVVVCGFLIVLGACIAFNVGGIFEKRNPYDIDYHGRKFTYPEADDSWLYFDKDDLDLDDEDDTG
jgi:hypothetical protein